MSIQILVDFLLNDSSLLNLKRLGFLQILFKTITPGRFRMSFGGFITNTILLKIDLRSTSPTFGKYFATELSDKNGRLLWIPFGFAHGFCTLGEEPADVFYKVDSTYNPKTSLGIHWNDPELKIPWPVKNPIVSKADSELPTLTQFKEKFVHHFA